MTDDRPQNLGGNQVLIQLRAPTDSEASRINAEDLARLTGSVDAARVLLTGTMKDDARADNLAYCNLPSPPFFSVSDGQIIVIKGILLANGRSMDRRDGKPLEVSYVTCSSAEHVAVSGP